MTFSIPLNPVALIAAGSLLYISGYIVYCNIKMARYYRALEEHKKSRYGDEMSRSQREDHKAGAIFWPIVWPIIFTAWVITTPARLTRPRSV